ncbi:MAG TPA: hypothetical protein VK850_09890, partial [Candidatus Binatia bacterium]|nr:hypothetical protein [Candidatus Binatia bacterium]
ARRCNWTNANELGRKSALPTRPASKQVLGFSEYLRLTKASATPKSNRPQVQAVATLPLNLIHRPAGRVLQESLMFEEAAARIAHGQTTWTACARLARLARWDRTILEQAE